ncbi:MAG: GtrA family protein [Bacteroidia bacterium]
MTALKLQEFIIKFIKFGLVGFLGMLIDFGITYFIKEIVKGHKYVANGLGFAVAATTNYILNRYWTFQSKNPHIAAEYTQFIIVALFGLVINMGVLYYLHHNKKQNFYLAKLVATGVTLIWNFMANAFFTFA